MLDALHCFILILCCFSFFLLDFLKRIYLFVVGINAGVGMLWRGCEGQRRAWVLILGVCFVSDRLCSFSTPKPGHLSPPPVTPGGRRYFRCSLYVPGFYCRDGRFTQDLMQALLPLSYFQPLPPFVRVSGFHTGLELTMLSFNTPLSIFLAFKHILLFSALKQELTTL